jgi:hypothetical protein
MPSQLDRGTIRHHLDGFAHRWRTKIDSWSPAERGHSESSHAQTFWSDLLKQFGVIPERFSLFEHDAKRASTGKKGSIDVFWSGVFIGEAKSVGNDLQKAFDQALDYLSGGSIEQHEWPKFAIVTDFENVRVEKLGDDPWTLTTSIDGIADHVDQLIFLAGLEVITKKEEADASIRASKLMAKLYTAMVGDEADEGVGEEAPKDPSEEDEHVQYASMFLTRILFLLYGDDAGLWEDDLFYRFVLYDTAADNLGGQLFSLFSVLNTVETKRKNVPKSMAPFPYINGSLFAENMDPAFFTPQMREALLAACRFRWTQISPALFGAMFQLVKSKEARRQEGEHYTSEANILKVIEPLFLDELNVRADRLIAKQSTTIKELRAFRDSLSEHIFVDPACGSGNFLNLAYARLRALETRVIVAIREREGQKGMSFDATLETKLTINQFHGIEINWWPAKIAETAMFLVDHQANRQLAAAIGAAPDRLPITITAHIHHADALEVDWSTLIPVAGGKTYVFGNPPFVGHETRSDQQAAQLRKLWKTDEIGRLDYVTGWHVKTLALLAASSGDWGYVSTNSITQGDQVPRLFGAIFDAGWRIKFAHRTFAWDSQAPGAAVVHCVIVAFTKDRAVKQRLFDYATAKSIPVEEGVERCINAYLIDGPNVLVTKSSRPLSAEIAKASYGNMPRDDGNLLVEVEDYDAVIADPIAAKYVRRFLGANELIYDEDRWCLWLADKDFDPSDVAKSPVLKSRLAAVKAFRSKSTAASTREMANTPYLFGQRSHTNTPQLGIPRHVAKDRRYFTVRRLGSDVIIGDANFAMPDDTGVQFGLISSSMFITWQKAVGGRIKSDPRFASTLTWNTFPVPALNPPERQAIALAGKGVEVARNLHPERSLAVAYDPLAMDPKLIKAHNDLDRAVDKAFGAKKRLSTNVQRLELLFDSYARLTTDKSVRQDHRAGHEPDR